MSATFIPSALSPVARAVVRHVVPQAASKLIPSALVGGSAVLGGATLGGIAVPVAIGVGLWALTEGLSSQSVSKASLGDIDPALIYPTSSQEIIPPGEPPFTGGQSYGVYYYVEGTYNTANTRNNSQYDGSSERTWSTSSRGVTVPGQIQGAEFADLGFGQILVVTAIDANGYTHQPIAGQTGTGNFIVLVSGTGDYGAGKDNYANASGVSITRTFRADGQPDTGGDPPTTPAVISAQPPAIKPSVKNLGQTTTNTAAVANSPLPPNPATKNTSVPSIPAAIITNANPGGTEGKANNLESPQIDTSPTNQINRIDNEIPQTTPTAATMTANAGGTVVRRTIAGGGATTGRTSQIFPAPTANQSGTSSGAGTVNPLDNGAKTGTETAQSFTAGVPMKQTEAPQIGDLVGDFSPGAISAITAALFAPTNLAKVKATTKDALCESSQQAGGCLNQNLKQPTLNGQNHILDAINALGQSFDLAALGRIDAKLGAQIEPGGLSGFLKKAWASTTLDKALNLMNTALLLHNAAHLSRNIGQTVGDVIGNALATIGIKDAEGNSIDFNQTIGRSVTNLIKSIIGAENYEGLSVSWAKANRIYQTGMNMLYSVRNLADATTAVAEIAAENIGVVGNALKRAGTIRENAFPDLPEKVNGQSRLIRFLDQAEEVADTFENITSNTREVREELAEINQDRQELSKQITEVVKESEKTNQENKNLAIATPEPQLGDEVEGSDE